MPETIEKEELYIKNPSQELFRGAINTFPLTPKCFEISMIAEGIPYHFSSDNKKRNEYVKECLSKGVIPHSKSVMHFNDNENLFLPRSIDSHFIGVPKDVNDLEFQKIVVGGKFYENIFKADRFKIEEALNLFRQVLPYLTEQGYQIGEVDFITSMYHLTEYNEGDYRDTGLKAVDGNLKDWVGCLELNVNSSHYDSKLKDADKEKLISWFEELNDKYIRKQPRMF